jgi:hypothetical protein
MSQNTCARVIQLWLVQINLGLNVTFIFCNDPCGSLQVVNVSQDFPVTNLTKAVYQPWQRRHFEELKRTDRIFYLEPIAVVPYFRDPHRYTNSFADTTYREFSRFAQDLGVEKLNRFTRFLPKHHVPVLDSKIFKRFEAHDHIAFAIRRITSIRDLKGDLFLPDFVEDRHPEMSYVSSFNEVPEGAPENFFF